MSVVALSNNRIFKNQSLYEKLIIISFIFAIAQEALHMPAFISEIGVVGGVLNLIITPLFALAVGMAVSRLRSRIAAVFFLLTLALGMGILLSDISTGNWGSIAFGLGSLSMVLDGLAAILILNWLFKAKS